MFYKKCDNTMNRLWRRLGLLLCIIVVSCTQFWNPMKVMAAAPEITAGSAIMIEASTGQILYEKNARERRSPASITKIMTLLIAFEKMEEGKISLDDQVLVSNHASSMGGSQVYLAEGEVQTLDTMHKCIMVSSGNDASVAVAEHIAGSEEAFVDMMNIRALELGMTNTHFIDCCGLSDSDEHYTTAEDVAIMSRELTYHPDVFKYSGIWMEDIVHVTPRGSSVFTLSSTNKLLKQYQWATGLKTGSTTKAKYCLSASASKDGVDLIAVILGADSTKLRFSEAKALLSYGFANCKVYCDKNRETLDPIKVRGGVSEYVPVKYEKPFSYVDMNGKDLSKVKREMELPTELPAPTKKGQKIGEARYYLEEEIIGTCDICCDEDVAKADFLDYLYKCFAFYLF